mmetsp:Transcript_88718/g.192132  ORF Transcript_88718/g.192132 Transcript_88718/m.192132 type:complete len:274 (+) Transcript_88718:473-1294(+)
MHDDVDLAPTVVARHGDEGHCHGLRVFRAVVHDNVHVRAHELDAHGDHEGRQAGGRHHVLPPGALLLVLVLLLVLGLPLLVGEVAEAAVVAVVAPPLREEAAPLALSGRVAHRALRGVSRGGVGLERGCAPLEDARAKSSRRRRQRLHQPAGHGLTAVATILADARQLVLLRAVDTIKRADERSSLRGRWGPHAWSGAVGALGLPARAAAAASDLLAWAWAPRTSPWRGLQAHGSRRQTSAERRPVARRTGGSHRADPSASARPAPRMCARAI